MVNQQGDVRAISSIWKVIVTVDVPKVPKVLLEDIARITRIITTAPATIPTRAALRRRIDNILINLPTYHHYQKEEPILAGRVRAPRGILDPLGILVHDIFGLATTKEVENIRAVIKDVGQNQ
jgi:hypothetical protein